MSLVLVVGVGPLPEAREQHVYATGLRVLTMLRALHGEGHECVLLEIPFGRGDARKSACAVPLRQHATAPPDVAMIREQVDALCARHRFDAVVALTDIGALGAAQSAWTGPLWVDYFGHPAAERQQQAHRHSSNAALAEYWRTVLPVLLRADRFSVCSNAQRLALVGELGASGRLNAESCGTDLVSIIPPAVGIDRETLPRPRAFLQSHGIPRESRVLLSTGGMNTWFDEETFFQALMRTMVNEDDIWLVVTGGTITGHSTIVFERFRARVESSPIANRTRFLGWLPHDDFLVACQEAHVAVSCDLRSLEAELGCRNRVLGWLWLGLRVISTAIDEHTVRLAELGYVRTFRPGDARGLSDAMLAEFKLDRRDAEELDELRNRLLEFHSAEAGAAVLARWADDPKTAPDRPVNGTVSNPLVEWHRHALGLREPEPDRGLQARADAAEELVARLQGSRAFNMYFAGRPEIRALLERIRKP